MADFPNADYWVAVATVAPVIAIGYLLILERVVEMSIQYILRRVEAKHAVVKWGTYVMRTFVIIFVVFSYCFALLVLTIFAMWEALRSLQEHRDTYDPLVITNALGGSLAVLVVLSIITVIVKSAQKRIEQNSKKRSGGTTTPPASGVPGGGVLPTRDGLDEHAPRSAPTA